MEPYPVQSALPNEFELCGDANFNLGSGHRFINKKAPPVSWTAKENPPPPVTRHEPERPGSTQLPKGGDGYHDGHYKPVP